MGEPRAGLPRPAAGELQAVGQRGRGAGRGGPGRRVRGDARRRSGARASSASGIGPERLQALRDAADVTVYTPGSTAGVPLDVVGSLRAPRLSWESDEEALRDEIQGDRDGPSRPRRHRRPTRWRAASTCSSRTWSRTRGAPGRDLDLGTLIGEIQSPPLRKLGVFELDQFFPPADRTKLAFTLNALVASPTFAAWGEGDALDPQALLFTPEGKPRCAVVYLAHLSEEERQFVVTLVFSKLVTWMRGQEGTPDLRALAYMDEVFGYVPPSASPPAEEADPHDLQAGPRVRPRARALDPEPRRPRLQGDVERRDVARRAPPDGERQGAGARGPALGGRRHGCRGARQGDRRPRQAPVPPRLRALLHPAPLRDPLGDVVPLRPAHEGSGRAPRAGRRRASCSLQLASRRAAPADAAAPCPSTRSRPTSLRSRRPSRRASPSRTSTRPRPGRAAIGAVAGTTRLRAFLAARVSLRYDDSAAGVDEQEEFEAVYGPLDGTLDLDSETQVDYDERDFCRVRPRRRGVHPPRASRSRRTRSSRRPRRRSENGSSTAGRSSCSAIAR